jgi:uncharacterized OsmC-like protein
MSTSEVIYLGDLRTSAVHTLSGDRIITDAPPDNQGRGEAFSPTDLMSTSLASCLLTVTAIACRTHHIPFDNTRAEVTKIMASNPRRVAAIHVDVFLPEYSYTDKEKAIIEHSARTCPVALSLHPDIEQKIRFNYGG